MAGGGNGETSEITLADVHAKLPAIFVRDHLNGAVLAVGNKIRGLVGDEIAAADDAGQVFEITIERAEAAGKDRLSATALGDRVENMVCGSFVGEDAGGAVRLMT